MIFIFTFRVTNVPILTTCDSALCRDFNKYYDAMPTQTLTGAQNAQYAEFSGKALIVAQQKLDSFLALLPSQAKADAIAQMPVY
jgi:hypothetical protein